MKTVYFDENPIKTGMIFKTAVAVSEFLNMNDKTHTNYILERLSHFCKFHRDDNKCIIIDEAFDKVIPYKVRGYKYEIGETITVNTGSYLIIDRYQKEDPYGDKKCNAYLCRCLKDYHEFELFEYRIAFGIGCPLCGGRKVVPGIRSLYDERPDLLVYFKDPEVAKSLTPYSGKRVKCICPECLNEKTIAVSNLSQYGFSCGYCSDTLTYPNKFVRKMLDQLGIDYVPEKIFDWSNGKRYDEFIPCKNLIIENHGSQHYKTVSHFRQTVEEQQRNDLEKRIFAAENGVQIYIEIDCRESSLAWIKNSIMNSSLPSILGFTENDIDWEECHLFAASNQIIKDICDYWKTNNNITDIAKKYKIDKHTVSDYLEIGAKCGYCDFVKNDYTKNGRQYAYQVKSKPIYCITDDIYFFSKKECEEYYKSIGDKKFNGYSLYTYINSSKEYHNKMFRYVSKADYNDKKKESATNQDIIVIGELYIEKYIKEE